MSTPLQLDLNINYRQPEEKVQIPCSNCGFRAEEDRKSDFEVSLNYINFAVGDAHKAGLDGQQRRIWGRIGRKLDRLEDSDSEEKILDLESAEVDFLKKAFSEAKVPAPLSKYFIDLETAFEDAIKKQKDNETK